MKNLRSVVMYLALCLGLPLGFGVSAVAQCSLSFSPNPGPGIVTIETYWTINGGVSGYYSPNNLALFQDTVTTGNSTVPKGTYLGWCIDVNDNIVDGPESYNVLMFSTCDPNLDAELLALGTSYSFTYPGTVTGDTAAQWNQVNYLLNHKLSGATYWDIQAALWYFIGGPSPSDAWFASHNYPQYTQANVTAMINDTLTHAASWQPQCGDVIAVVLAIIAPANGYFPVQLNIIEVPIFCQVASGDAATIGFWHNKNGQALINSLNGGPTSTLLGNWLAVNFPCLYGNLAGKANSIVAAQFLTFFNVKGAKTQAQILAGALACYVTDPTLAGGTAASKYGFNISTLGTSVKTYNVGSDGTAIGLSNNTFYTVLQLLDLANTDMCNHTFNALAIYFNDIFDGINSQGDIN